MIEKKYSSFDAGVVIISAIISVLLLMPLLYVIANAFSNPVLVYSGKVGFFPKEFTFKNLADVFAEKTILRGFKNTIIYTVSGTVVQVALQFSVGYPLSRKDLRGKKLFNIFFSLPMFISGGMIPTYLVVKTLGMLNTIWALVIPGCLGLYNVIIIRTYLASSIPYELTEASMIDGCSPLQTFFRVILPCCKPILCVMALFAIVGYWNSYFNSIIYTTNEEVWPLQRVLARLLVKTESSGSLGSAENLKRAAGLKYAVILVSSLPLLAIYPVFQKYFEKGFMVGSIKG